jgi:succinyl-diaminopimelate desuccinylase
MDYVKVLADLISIDTSVPPGRNYEQALDLLGPLFRQAGCQTEKVYIPRERAGGEEGRVNLIVHRRNPGKRRLIFYTHVDVVPARGWDAFNPRIEDGKIYGRGAVDMKGAVVSLLLAMERLKGRMINYDLSALISVDEETGHADGEELRCIRSYLEPVAGAGFFNLDSPDFVHIADLGVYACEITVHGRSVHQGSAYLGENAVENAIKLCQPLLKLGEEVGRRVSRIPCDPSYKVPYLQPNLTITMVHGGIKVNIVPDECVISVARRILPEEDIEAAEKEILDTLRSVAGVRWDVKRIMYVRPFPPAIDEPEVEKLSRIVRQVTGKTGRYGTMMTVPLDTIGFEWQAQIFGIGLMRPENNPHGIDEFVYIKDVENLAAIIENFIISAPTF